MKNRTISAPKMPKKGGAVFVGWYRDEFCKIPWKLSVNKANETVICECVAQLQVVQLHIEVCQFR